MGCLDWYCALYVFSQVPDPNAVMTAAEKTGSWVIVLLCFIVICLIGGFGYLSRLVLINNGEYVAKMREEHNDQIEALKGAHGDHIQTLVDSYEKRINEVLRDSEQRSEEAKSRESRMAARIEKLEDVNNSQLVQLVTEQVKITASMQTTLANFTSSLTNLCGLLENAPCVASAAGAMSKELENPQV